MERRHILSGDTAATEELRRIVPQAELVTVKEGLAATHAFQFRLKNPSKRFVPAPSGDERSISFGPIESRAGHNPVEYTTRNSLPIDAGLAQEPRLWMTELSDTREGFS